MTSATIQTLVHVGCKLVNIAEVSDNQPSDGYKQFKERLIIRGKIIISSCIFSVILLLNHRV